MEAPAPFYWTQRNRGGLGGGNRSPTKEKNVSSHEQGRPVPVAQIPFPPCSSIAWPNRKKSALPAGPVTPPPGSGLEHASSYKGQREGFRGRLGPIPARALLRSTPKRAQAKAGGKFCPGPRRGASNCRVRSVPDVSTRAFPSRQLEEGGRQLPGCVGARGPAAPSCQTGVLSSARQRGVLRTRMCTRSRVASLLWSETAAEHGSPCPTVSRGLQPHIRVLDPQHSSEQRGAVWVPQPTSVHLWPLSSCARGCSPICPCRVPGVFGESLPPSWGRVFALIWLMAQTRVSVPLLQSEGACWHPVQTLVRQVAVWQGLEASGLPPLPAELTQR